MSFDAVAALALLRTFDVTHDGTGKLAWADPMRQTILDHGLDLYREICCAMGSEATAAHHRQQARASGSTWDEAALEGVYLAVRDIPFNLQVLPHCSFLHFGATRQLIDGLALVQQDLGAAPAVSHLSINNEIGKAGGIAGPASWVEGCRLTAPLALAGNSVVVGVDVDEPLSLPEGACLDVIYGHDRAGEKAWFVRCYGVNDAFKDRADGGALFCGQPLLAWLAAVGAKPEDVWDANVLPEPRTLWDARLSRGKASCGVPPLVMDVRSWRGHHRAETGISFRPALQRGRDRLACRPGGLLFAPGPHPPALQLLRIAFQLRSGRSYSARRRGYLPRSRTRFTTCS